MRHINSFTATDQDGNRYWLVVYGSSLDIETTDSPGDTIPGPKRIMLDNETVTRVSKGKYLTHAGKRLTSDDPYAE